MVVLMGVSGIECCRQRLVLEWASLYMRGTSFRRFTILRVGCGKSTIGKLLAERIGGSFHDGDDFHSVENVEKMSAGVPLCDEDRKEWLEGIVHAFGGWDRRIIHVLACSALRQAYRDVLEAAEVDLNFVLLNGDAQLIRERLQARTGHFMGSSLLQSQIALLEPPKQGLVVDISAPPETVVSTIVSSLGLSRSA